MKQGKCFLYCRQSSGQEEANNSTSISQQLDNCRNSAEKHGLKIVDLFTDANVSGKTYPSGRYFEQIAENDPGFRKWFSQQTSRKKYRDGLGAMLSRLDEVEYIVVDEITRLHRSAGSSFLEQTINYVITEARVKILQVKGGIIDLARFDQNLIQILRTQINDEQIANQKKKSIESRKRLRDSGLLCDAKFFGAVYDGDKCFHYDAACIPAIRYIFRSIASNIPYGEVWREVNRRWKDLFPGKKFYESTLYSIARQPAYAGFMYNTGGELIPCRSAPPPVIDPALFFRVLRIMGDGRRTASRPRSAENRRHFLPLSGLLKCGGCGGGMRVSIDCGKIFYVCPNAALTNSRECRNSRILDVHEKSFTAGLRQAVMPLILLGLYREYEGIKKIQAGEQSITELQRMQNKLSEKLKTVFQLFREDVLDEENYISITRRAAEDLHLLKLREKEIEASGSRNWDRELELLHSNIRELVRDRTLRDETRLSALIRESIKDAVVHENAVLFETVCGNFTLPRIRGKQHRRLLPEWELSNRNGNLLSEETHFRIIYRAPGFSGKVLLRTDHADVVEKR